MGCDIHNYIQSRSPQGSWIEMTDEIFEWDEIRQDIYRKPRTAEPFWWRSYSLFAFLAGVRNYSNYPTPVASGRGLPEGSRDPYGDDYDGHSPSWVGLDELIHRDYDEEFYDERSKERSSVRDWLGEDYFKSLAKMRAFADEKGLGYHDVRIVFSFDN